LPKLLAFEASRVVRNELAQEVKMLRAERTKHLLQLRRLQDRLETLKANGYRIYPHSATKAYSSPNPSYAASTTPQREAKSPLSSSSSSSSKVASTSPPSSNAPDRTTLAVPTTTEPDGVSMGKRGNHKQPWRNTPYTTPRTSSAATPPAEAEVHTPRSSRASSVSSSVAASSQQPSADADQTANDNGVTKNDGVSAAPFRVCNVAALLGHGNAVSKALFNAEGTRIATCSSNGMCAYANVRVCVCVCMYMSIHPFVCVCVHVYVNSSICVFSFKGSVRTWTLDLRTALEMEADGCTTPSGGQTPNASSIVRESFDDRYVYACIYVCVCVCVLFTITCPFMPHVCDYTALQQGKLRRELARRRLESISGWFHVHVWVSFSLCLEHITYPVIRTHTHAYTHTHTHTHSHARTERGLVQG
jgi:hypothetical protein